MDGASQDTQSETCKECGWQGKYLLHHLNRTKLPCKESYDIDALKRAAYDSTRDKKALREREKYHNDPAKKRAASREYYRENSEFKKQSVKDHYYASKSETSQHQCDICEKEFVSPKHMTRHIEHIHSDKFPPLICQVCDGPLKYKESLDRHMREVHGGEKEYECPNCPEDFSRLENCQRHLDRGRHTFKCVCEYCDKTFLFKGDIDFEITMKRHYLVGTDRNKYRCRDLHTSCIEYHCLNEKDLSDEKREELLRKRTERECPRLTSENWETVLQDWRNDLKEYRDKENAKRKWFQDMKNTSFTCRFCKTTCSGIYVNQHQFGSVGCGCKGCNVAGFTHDLHKMYKMDECPLHRPCITHNKAWQGRELREWKDRVDSGDWKVDQKTYEKYAAQLKDYEERCRQNQK